MMTMTMSASINADDDNEDVVTTMEIRIVMTFILASGGDEDAVAMILCHPQVAC